MYHTTTSSFSVAIWNFEFRYAAGSLLPFVDAQPKLPQRPQQWNGGRGVREFRPRCATLFMTAAYMQFFDPLSSHSPRHLEPGAATFELAHQYDSRQGWCQHASSTSSEIAAAVHRAGTLSQRNLDGPQKRFLRRSTLCRVSELCWRSSWKHQWAMCHFSPVGQVCTCLCFCFMCVCLCVCVCAVSMHADIRDRLCVGCIQPDLPQYQPHLRTCWQPTPPPSFRCPAP